MYVYVLTCKFLTHKKNNNLETMTVFHQFKPKTIDKYGFLTGFLGGWADMFIDSV